jgi:hypothetical protein
MLIEMIYIREYKIPQVGDMMEEIWKKFYNIEVSNMGHVKTSRNKDGTYTGNNNTKGYKKLKFRIDGKLKGFYIHRLVSHLFNDVALDDPRQVDHINGVRDDNRVENLRMVSQSENQCNAKSHRNGKLPYTTFDKNSNKWASQITINNKNFTLGRFNTMEEAYECSVKKRKELNLSI